ncbi:DUF692 domain-containing protein [Thiothrix litoralis]|uniref:UPF0276 protein J9253_16745 n=1 Tax=Thiothrix litoralis TaxID=2891210 RepID=A0ABX7WTB8_9GAMM|nr:DUF692 domain-containing protein [Thiothrix litoralis]QTR45633.1 DUF692 domain-containing protein [Thiothrix litoralis]
MNLNTTINHPVSGCGVGLRPQHIDQITDTKPAIPWLEILTDNYLLPGSVQQDYLFEIAEHYPLTFHGVGMSLGSTDPLNSEYFKRVKALVERVNPAWVSDHLCWTSVHGLVTHDLIPLPYTEETIRHAASRIRQAQDMLGRRLVIENVSSYLQYQQSTMSEWDFLCAVAEEADCHILLDVNNIYVSACNHDFAPLDYLNAIPVERVQEIHLAGYEDRGTHLLDTHGYPVSDAVWELYAQAIQRLGAIPTLIEWDNNVPELGTLLTEARKAAEVQAHALA